MRLDTARLTLRPPEARDLPRMFEIYSDPRTNIHEPALTWRSPAEAEEKLARWQDCRARNGWGHWALAEAAAPERLIGFAGLSERLYGETPRINLGYRFAPEVWGRGYASETALALVAEARRHGIRQIHALVRPSNLASRRVLEKAGFRPDGEIDDCPGEAPTLILSQRLA